MTSKLKVNLINDSGDNNIITSDGSGDVTCKVSDLGVNQTTLTAKLEVNQDVHDGITAQFINSNSGNSGSEVYLIKDSSSPADNDNIGTFKFLANDDGGSQKNFSQIQSVLIDATASSSNGELRFSTRSSNSISERMRIDGSGNVLVGKTSSGQSVQGIELEGNNGALLTTRTNDLPLLVNRLGNDGTLVSLRQASTEELSLIHI